MENYALSPEKNGQAALMQTVFSLDTVQGPNGVVAGNKTPKSRSKNLAANATAIRESRLQQRGAPGQTLDTPGTP